MRREQPHPPIWIGAGGEQMMAVVAQYADVWNVTGASSLEEAAERNRRLDEACRQAGRDPAAVRRSAQHMWDGRDRHHLLDTLPPSSYPAFPPPITAPSPP